MKISEINWTISHKVPSVTITKNTLNFNKYAVECFQDTRYLQIGFLHEELKVAFRKIDEPSEEDYFYTFKDREKDGWVRISCKEFIAYLSSYVFYDFETSKRFLLLKDNESDLYYIDLKKLPFEDNVNKDMYNWEKAKEILKIDS